MDKKTMHMLTFWLVVLGGLNWGLIGLLDLNLVNNLLGASPILERVFYILVGLSSLYLMADQKK